MIKNTFIHIFKSFFISWSKHIWSCSFYFCKSLTHKIHISKIRIKVTYRSCSRILIITNKNFRTASSHKFCNSRNILDFFKCKVVFIPEKWKFLIWIKDISIAVCNIKRTGFKSFSHLCHILCT